MRSTDATDALQQIVPRAVKIGAKFGAALHRRLVEDMQCMSGGMIKSMEENELKRNEME